MITSTANRQIKYVSALLKKAKARREEQLFVAEGVRMCMEIPPERIRTLYISDSFRKNTNCAALTERVRQVEVLTDTVFAALSDTRTPQGVLAVAEQSHYCPEDLTMAGPDGAKPLLLVLEQIQDPGNLGTVLRAGEGAGVTGILMDGGTADIYNPKVVRSTMGALFRVPYLVCDDMSTEVERLKQEGFVIYAAHLSAERDYTDEHYADRAAVLIGNEAGGLSDAVSGRADTLLKIPMEGELESLNAAVSAALFMYELYRSRKNVLQ